MKTTARTLTSCSVAKAVAGNVEVLPDDESLDCSELEGFERILDTEAVFSCILTDLIEVFLDEPLLLDEFDVGQGFGCQLDCLWACSATF